MGTSNQELHCSFCFKPQLDCRLLIKSDDVQICEVCVALCVEIALKHATSAVTQFKKEQVPV